MARLAGDLSIGLDNVHRAAVGRSAIVRRTEHFLIGTMHRIAGVRGGSLSRPSECERNADQDDKKYATFTEIMTVC